LASLGFLGGRCIISVLALGGGFQFGLDWLFLALALFRGKGRKGNDKKVR